MEEMLSIVKQRSGKYTESRFEQMLAFMKKIAGQSADQKNEESSEVTKEEVLRSEDGSKDDEEDPGKYNNSSLLPKAKRRMEMIQGRWNRKSLTYKEPKKESGHWGEQGKEKKRKTGGKKVKDQLRRRMKGIRGLTNVRGREVDARNFVSSVRKKRNRDSWSWLHFWHGPVNSFCVDSFVFFWLFNGRGSADRP